MVSGKFIQETFIKNLPSTVLGNANTLVSKNLSLQSGEGDKHWQSIIQINLKLYWDEYLKEYLNGAMKTWSWKN